ncbi:MAG: serine hydroxymethyltransferase [Pseudomonadales bacterium]|jgi:glycine hydroxymethyltransferase|nr:serine hydroxymethyltransferase [Pseudomonadales bacterium]MDP6315907.1 serine hydroxymethyltransferase [Pseudomonadales bacterium]MDP7314259.1 serine hydroxymethyltransferase [Pseudomonadales bacterium]MDP7576610.1 serine hydroxymethyltransferase [Pseudomonadales bacterium]HJP50660.1 serine hydroxymethyltransferase [Pseudomonadales bacterium]|tara:strand:+ start:11585 stop:12844 length:1260 start_codon:yes stop_codon:yes gene_type:complete
MTSNLEYLAQNDPDVYNALKGEEQRQQSGIELIPSENYTFPEVLAALGSVFTNKYSEGYPGRRYYGGQEFTDQIETLARDRAKQVFRCEHANVQPLSGSAMNQAVYLGLLDPGDTILAMDLSHGGHLTHGAPVSHMGKLFNFVRYVTDPVDGAIDFDRVREDAIKNQPKLILAGYTSYPRDLEYEKFKQIADEVGAITMTDASHFGGLVAGGSMKNPFDYGFDIVTTTTHKSLRGPRGGMVLCKKEFATKIDKSVFPGLQGGPHMNAIAAIAVTLLKAQSDEFKQYAQQVLDNSKALAQGLIDRQASLITGGTDNHMMVMDTLVSYGLDGRVAEEALDKASITTNKQIIPDDPNPPLRPSGIRIGTPAATSRGMVESDMERLAEWIVACLTNADDSRKLDEVRGEVEAFCSKFPVPGVE